MSVARQYTTTPGSARATGPTRLVPTESTVSSGPAAPLSVILLGIVTILVAGWGAAAPFAGPDFGFVADRYSAWTWSTTSALLALAPGALAFLCGLAVVGASARPSYRRRPDLWLLGLLVVLSGAWFVVGQYVWPVIESKLFIVPSGATHYMWKELAFAIGPGVILVFCGATFMGWAVRRQLAVAGGHALRDGAAPATSPARERSAARGTTAATAGTGPAIVERRDAERTGVARTTGTTGAAPRTAAARTAGAVGRTRAPSGTGAVAGTAAERPAGTTTPV